MRNKHGKHILNPGFKPGEHWVTCQRCDFDYYSRDVKREWTGQIVCRACYEERHPQDFVRSRRDRITPRGPINPDTSDGTFESNTLCPPSAIAGLGKAGCAIAGNNSRNGT